MALTYAMLEEHQNSSLVSLQINARFRPDPSAKEDAVAMIHWHDNESLAVQKLPLGVTTHIPFKASPSRIEWDGMEDEMSLAAEGHPVGQQFCQVRASHQGSKIMLNRNDTLEIHTVSWLYMKTAKLVSRPSTINSRYFDLA